MTDAVSRADRSRTRGRAELLARIEAMAVDAREKHWAVIPAALAQRLRPRTRRFADGFATLMRGSDSLRVNRVIGVGHRERVARSLIDEVIGFYREAGIRRFAFELGPGPQFEGLATWLGEAGFVRRGGFSLYVRDLRQPVARGPREIRTLVARGASLTTSFELAETIFAMPVSRRSWTAAAARSRATHHFLALIDGQAIGIGALRVDGDLAWFGGGGTLTRFRKRGVQSALIAARLRRAAKLGCRWAWSETSEPRAGGPQGSRRNLMRLGFVEVVIRLRFVWEASGRTRRGRGAK